MQHDHIPKKFNFGLPFDMFILIAPLPACNISVRNIDNALVIAKFKYLTFDPLGKNFDTAMLIYRHWAIRVYSEKLLNIIALRKCEDHYT